MSTDSHYNTIKQIRAELATIDDQLAALKSLTRRRCALRCLLLSEVGAMIAEARKIDPCRELATARGRATGVSDA